MSEKTEQKLAEIDANKPVKVKGFKILGCIPFYLGFIKTSTYIEYCGLKAKIREIKSNETIKYSDFDDAELLKKVVPIMREICVVGLLNDSIFSKLIRWYIEKAVYRMRFEEMFNLYVQIAERSDPSFFFYMLNQTTLQDHTLLKEAKQSSDT